MKKINKSSKSVHFNMIHVNPRAGLKCVNYRGNPGTFFCQMPCPQASLETIMIKFSCRSTSAFYKLPDLTCSNK